MACKMGLQSEGKTPLLTEEENNIINHGQTLGNLPQSTRVFFQQDQQSQILAEARIPTGQSRCAWMVETVLKIVLSVGVVCGFMWTGSKLWTSISASKQITIVNEKIFYQETLLIHHHYHSSESAPMCDIGDDSQRFDCHPGLFASPKACEERGCCWRPATEEYVNTSMNRPTSVPWCYFPLNYPHYEATGIKPTPYGYTVDLHRNSNASGWPGNLDNLLLDISLETDTRLHFKIIDKNNSRYTVPIDTPKGGSNASHPEYIFQVKSKPFGFIVKRRKTDRIIFDSTIAPFLYADQYIQMSTSVPSGFVYGLGEHRSAFNHNITHWEQFSFWARDQPPEVNKNLYGVHPFFMSIEQDGNAYGVFLLNSNAMDIDIQPLPALTYRTIGGILDFYIFMGPTPMNVVQQYADVVGRPALPPYWALGFHLCRWGYGGTAGIQKVIQRMRNASFPYDVQWMDIDYMDRRLDWTYDLENYKGLPDVVKDIHDHDQHFVIIVDPGISNQNPGKYTPYDTGMKKDVFVKDYQNKPLEGIVWPGRTVYPDFSNPAAEDWWFECAKSFHDQIPFDGLWTDMNEPSNFAVGSTNGCSKNSLDNPPYTPGITGGILESKTLCPSAQHHLGSHYNLHSMYGHMEARASHKALEKLRGKRSLVITRSTFPSTGLYAGHWSGDNVATWDDLYYSIPVMMSFQMFAIPLVGSDTCGFSGETTEELCTRWMQLAAFYPFMRNHNMIDAKDQDPAVFSSDAQRRMKDALVLRYTLLPYLYTLFYNSHVNGTTVVNPLSFIYPADSTTHSIDRQFMWGKSLLISPVLNQGGTTVNAYFPKDTWYDMLDGSAVSYSGVWTTLNAPLDRINVHIRGGSIIPQQPLLTATTTTKARNNPFILLVALDVNGAAQGQLYWDDGDTINPIESGNYSTVHFSAAQGQMLSKVTPGVHQPVTGLILKEITIMGIKAKPSRVTVNSSPVNFSWDAAVKVLEIRDMHLNLLQDWIIKWN